MTGAKLRRESYTPDATTVRRWSEFIADGGTSADFFVRFRVTLSHARAYAGRVGVTLPALRSGGKLDLPARPDPGTTSRNRAAARRIGCAPQVVEEKRATGHRWCRGPHRLDGLRRGHWVADGLHWGALRRCDGCAGGKR